MNAISTAGGEYWRLVSPKGPVHVWRPRGYRGDLAVAYLHGYYVNVDEAMQKHKLLDQFVASGVQALFVVPETPKSNEQGVFWKSLPELLGFVNASVGASAKTVHAVAHSGGYRTVLDWLPAPELQRVTLLDALYAGVTTFANWAARAGHRLVTVAITGTPLTNSLKLAGKANVTVVRESTTHMGLVEKGSYIAEYIRLGAPAATAGVAALIALLVAGLGFWYYRSNS